jgi:cytochrome P450
MRVMPLSLHRAIDARSLSEDPLAFLAAARRRCGDAVVIREDAPLFSPGPECPGVVALFGSGWQRRVLTDTAHFVSPPSTARSLALPDLVVNLNRSLHSMQGSEHEAHKAVAAAALTPALLAAEHHAVVAAVNAFADAWRAAGSIAVFAGMRRLMAEVAVILLFGAAHPARAELQAALTRFFDVRRQVSAESTTAVAQAGTELAALLDAAAAHAPERPAGRLAKALSGPAAQAHLTVFFMSIAEPVTVALTWLLLLLSQQPALRRALRGACRSGDAVAAAPPEMERVILETLRLLSPNAVMVRVTSQPVECAGALLPEGCEIVLAPFLTHRDPAVFPEPTIFLPDRWIGSRPSAFDYLPFGAGAHACVGKHLAIALIATVIGGVLSRVDPVLAREQSVDWRIDITFRPRFDLDMAAGDIFLPEDQPVVKWHGPVADMVRFRRDNS